MNLRAAVCVILLFGFVLMGTMACGKKGPPRPPDEAGYAR